MDHHPGLRRPWLVAAWPGMGAVGQIASTHLAGALQAQRLGELEVARFHQPAAIRVEQGLVQPWRAPRCVLHGWHNPQDGEDLLLLLTEQQPAIDLRGYSGAVLERARALDASRVVTFAAMGTSVHPGAEPRVFAVASEPKLLRQALSAGAVRLDDGEISGMNGLMLGAAGEQGLPALGLLGEMPYYAAGLPNPKSAAAVLRVFGRLAGVAPDLRALDEQARRLEQALAQHMPHDARSGRPPAGGDTGPQPGADPGLRQQIESLFEVAGADRARALELKTLLDRHGLFRDYEDRFLDLFRRGS